MRANRADTVDFDVAPSTNKDKTLLGSLSGGARAWLYFLACLIALAALGATYHHVDRKLELALNDLQAALRIDELAHAVERGTYSLQARQRSFLLTREMTNAESFAADLADVSTALDELFATETARNLSQEVTTIRDGLVQYDQQFQEFVTAEREIGLGSDIGLRAQLQQTSGALSAAFADAGVSNLINQIERIDEQGEETVLSGSKKGVEEIRKRYEALLAFLQAAQLSDEQRNHIDTLMKTHETQMLSMINTRFNLAGESRRFEDLFEYMVPSLQAVTGFAVRERIEASAAVRNAHLFSRYTVAGGSVAVLVWLLFFGLLLLKSLSTPARQIADSVERITRGASHVNMPAQGNRDDFGRLSRLLDGWAETIISADQLRADLQREQARLSLIDDEISSANSRAAAAENRATQAERKAADAAEVEATLRTALERQSMAPKAEVSSPSPERVQPPTVPVAVEPAETPSGPISSVSQQLQSFTQYVTAAANDVERTEALIKGIEQMGGLVEEIGDLVLMIRDQTNLLAFRSPGSEAQRDAERGDDNLVPFANDPRNLDAERAYAQRFDQLRDAADRTERTALRIRETLNEINDIARGIAETASHQALEATHKLLNQSEYLQNMLDDILNKVQPAKPGQLSDTRQPRTFSDDPFA